MSVSNAPFSIAALRSAQAKARDEVYEKFLSQPQPQKLFSRLTKVVDETLISLWEHCEMPADAALVGVGGYGRGELFPYSDVDVLILVSDSANAQAGAIEKFVTSLWDVGLEIGHSVRTTEECLSEMKGDITIATTLLESRFVTGDEPLYTTFSNAFDQAVEPVNFIRGKLFEQEQRYNRYQDTAYNLEPNLKESPGGLRDLHMIRWLARAIGLPASWSGMAAVGLMPEADAQHIAKAERVEQDLRIRLHLTAKRREDRLVFDVQRSLAQSLGLDDTSDKRASEQLMERYYRAAKVVQQANHVLLAMIEDRVIPVKATPKEIDAYFQTVGDRLDVRDERVFERDPLQILRAFTLLVSRDGVKAFSPRVRGLLSSQRNQIDAKFHRRADAQALFMSVLRAPRGTYHALRAMNHYGVLGRYLPAWGKIVGQMQHDLFHVYTVDEHILMVLRNMRRFAEPQHAHEYPLCSELMSAFQKRELLYLACLFHDIAKGRGGDHSELGQRDALAFCELHGLEPADGALVAWLVDKHLVMSSTAQKQDITDPDVVRKFADLVQSEQRLVALYLLTVADVRGTSPKVWNSWKAKLLEDLFRATRRLLRGASTDTTYDVLGERMEQARAQLSLYAIDPVKAEPFWRTLDSVYLQRHNAEEIAWHARNLYFRLEEDGRNRKDPIVRTRLTGDAEAMQALVYVADQPKLFVRICGVLGELGYSILDAKVHTTKDGFALDTFTITHPEHARNAFRDVRQLLEHALTEALKTQREEFAPFSGRLNRMVKHLALAPQVRIRPDDRDTNHILEVIAADRPGLLFRLAQVLAQHKVTIVSARINTLGLRAEDTFLVKGETLSGERERVRIETALVEALQ
jgi:[protein-PII] uridylyltransferase